MNTYNFFSLQTAAYTKQALQVENVTILYFRCSEFLSFRSMKLPTEKEG